MAPRKQTLRKKAPAKGNAMKGESYTCESCGLVVTVDEDCGCVSACEIMCCDMPMKKSRASHFFEDGDGALRRPVVRSR